MTRPRWISAALGLCAAVLLTAFARSGPESAPVLVGGDDSWRTAAVWDDGKAEFAVYQVRWNRYGRLNPGKALMVLVKEPWDEAQEVKSDGAGDFDVLKLNHIRDVPTGIYTYHQMGSVFIGRDDGALRKVTATSIEACGQSSANMRKGELRAFTYWDGQAERTVPWPQNAVPEDGLPAILRGYLEGDLPESLSVFPSVMASRHGRLAPSEFSLERTTAPGFEVPAGRFDAVTIELSNGRQSMRYTFEAAMPHTLLKLERSDGTTYDLARVARLPYWGMSSPGNEGWWPESLR